MLLQHKKQKDYLTKNKLINHNKKMKMKCNLMMEVY